MFFSKIMHDAMGANIVLPVASVLYAAVSFIFLYFQRRRVSRQKIVFTILNFMLGSFIITNMLIQLFFYPSGQYLNHGAVPALLYLLLSLSISTTAMYYITRKFLITANPLNRWREVLTFTIFQPIFIISLFIFVVVVISP